MKIIKYFNNEFIGYKKEALKNKTPIFKLKQLEYKTKDDEFEYWLDIIRKTYGKFGEVTYIDTSDTLTAGEKRELEKQKILTEIADIKLDNMKLNTLNKKLLKESAQNRLDKMENDKVNKTLLSEVAKLNLELTNLKNRKEI